VGFKLGALVIVARVTTLTRRLRAKPLMAHADGYLGLAWPALEWLEENLEPEMTTLETGSGASTVVFAASACSHVAISPSQDEHDRIKRYCDEVEISTDRVRFIAESSDVALTSVWEPRPLDLVLIDGAHGFPFPILDWLYTAPHLRIGGRVLVDDAYQATVNLLARFLRSSPSWELEAVLGHRTPCYRKLDDAPLRAEWDDFELGRVKFDYLPPAQRLVAALRYRILDRSPLQALFRSGPLRLGGVFRRR
jgi:Methyltransferase domain